DSIKVIVDYIVKDTIVDCDTYSSWSNCSYCAYASPVQSMDASANKSTGKGGSMARFAILKNHLYAVTTSELKVFGLQQPLEPQLIDSKRIGNWNIETIFPFLNKLFIGSTSGMFMYDVSDPANPQPAGQFEHVRRCDPVIADEKNAYVTLRSGTTCTGFTNQLDVLNIEGPIATLVKSYPLTNPYGLTKQDDVLVVCDGTDGIKVYDAADASNLKLLQHIKGMVTYDAIANGDLLLVVATDGLYQYNISDPLHFKLLSKIGIKD
ncbi:MAG TPA: hypothetical protein VM012_15560, partial [Flavitalea sp.]|nr:hypothetical protein [Flavitalea sp.]